jgi:hypothetical protein
LELMSEAVIIRAPIRFSREEACEITGLPPGILERWEAAAAGAGFCPPPDFTLSGLVALAVLHACAGRPNAEVECATGVAQLFRLLAKTDLRRLGAQTVVIGRDVASLCEIRAAHVHFEGDAFLTIPLGPLIADLQDRVFA